MKIFFTTVLTLMGLLLSRSAFIINDTAGNSGRFDWSVFIILLCFWLFISFYLSRFISQKNNKIDAVFIVLLGLCLFIPMSRISDAEKSEKENRMLATKPALFVDGKINSEYGTQFDSWFNDRFNGRQELLRLYSHIKKSLSADDDSVLKGKDDWLFFKGENSLDNFQNKILFTDTELANVAQYLVDIDDWARKNGKNFYYVIAPDKNKIYGEHITTLKKIRPDSESRTNQLVQYLHENTNVKVVYLYDVLMKNKDSGLLYYKQDTHWNDFGAYFGYVEIMNLIKQQYPSLKTVTYSGVEPATWPSGDLKRMMSGLHTSDNTQYKRPVIDNNCPKCKKYKVFVLRDSFTEALKRYFDNTFNSVSYKTTVDVTPDDLQYMKNNTDIIIMEQVERYLPALRNREFPKD